jgi:threonine dehydrogenase-like Zn-dependent dehydrogenase
LELGESAIVMGLGVLGIIAVELLHAAGAYPIIAVDPVEKKRDQALSLGADYALDPFAPDFATAKRIFALAEANGTPCYSTSALRFADEYKDIDTDAITAANFWGPMTFETYSIHQLEPLFMLMKTTAEQVMMVPGENYYLLTIRFAAHNSIDNCRHEGCNNSPRRYTHNRRCQAPLRCSEPPLHSVLTRR